MSRPVPIPQVCPPYDVLDDLELARVGALPREALSLPLSESDALASQSAGGVEVVDPEGVPLARLGRATARRGRFAATGPVTWLGHASPRPFERLYRTPDQIAQDARRTTVVVDRRLTDRDVTWMTEFRAPHLLVLAGPSTAPSADTLATLREAEQAAGSIAGATLTALPFSTSRAAQDPALANSIIRAYAADSQVHRLPAHHRPVGDAARSGPGGLVVFFTGLSGSGKSTIARAVREAIVETQDRTVSLLDGDVVRRNLSAGLSFSPEDRDTNIRRIGWVAAEIAYHGGLVICSPIAPHDATREAVRTMVVDRGAQFLLIHVSTPVAECERRDRKGLYAKARAGEIADFTGVNAPYEEPQHPDVSLDTSTMTVSQARDAVLDLMSRHGYLRTPSGDEGAEWTH